MTNESLARRLGLKEAVALVIGTVIGTGVFLKAAVMSQQTGSPFWVLAAWIVAGLLSLTGALCYAELGAMYPKAGGEYVFLREAYGELTGFLFGWMRFWIGTPGSIAAYGVGAATFLNSIVDLDRFGGRATFALGSILLFSVVNCFSVILGGRLQAYMTWLKILMIVSLTGALFFAGSSGSWSHLGGTSGGAWMGWSAFGSAMIAALWAYDGWNNMPMAAGEIRDPEKNVPRALVIGMAAILVIYSLVNLAYFYALPFGEVLTAYSKTTKDALPVATKAAQSAFGPVAVGILSCAFVLSALGSMNGSILTGARIPFAMARDNLFFKQLGKISHASRSPVSSVIVQALISCALALSGTFDQLTDYVVFASWIFYSLATASLFLFRRRHPHMERPYRTPGYPWLPAVFLVCSALLLVNTLLTAPQESCIGLAFILAGIPVYYWFKRSRNASGGGSAVRGIEIGARSYFVLLGLLAAFPGMLYGEGAIPRRFIPELAHARQLIVVTTGNWDAIQASLRTFERDAPPAAWVEVRSAFPAVVGRNGMGWGIGCHGACATGDRCKHEGDGRAPAGVFRLGALFGYASLSESSVTTMPYIPLTALTVGVDDPASRYYNRVVDTARISDDKDWNSAEVMLRPDGLYRWGVIVEHNWDGRPGFGSCIFLHHWQGSDRGTSGCTAMAPEHLIQLIRWLDSQKHPVIVQLPRDQYEQWQSIWPLPSL